MFALEGKLEHIILISPSNDVIGNVFAFGLGGKLPCIAYIFHCNVLVLVLEGNVAHARIFFPCNVFS